MISNQILQTTVDGLKEISRVDLCVIDAEGKVVAKTFDNVAECTADALVFIDSPADSQVVNGYQFFKVVEDGNLEYIILAKGTTDDVFMLGKLAAFQIQNLLVAYKERFDKDNFIKNLLLDNLLRVDMYTRAEKLHIDTDVKRVVYIIETKHEKDINALETIRTLFASRTRDFITAVDEKSIILVREVKSNETYEDLDKTAEVIIDMLNTEAMSSAHIAYGTIVNDIREVSRSYKEANMALDVGKIFSPEKVGTLPVSKDTLDAIHKGLRMVMSKDGTGGQIFEHYPISIAGKSGTAETNGLDNGWFVAYAPFDKPEVVILCMFEHSGFGSESAAPVVKKMMDAYFHIGDYSPAKLKAADEAKAGGKKNG